MNAPAETLTLPQKSKEQILREQMDYQNKLEYWKRTGIWPNPATQGAK